jgi:hypothetical protein
MNEIFGITFVSPVKDGICNENFNNLSNGGDTDYYVSKEVYEHRENDDLNFDYRYLIAVMDMGQITGEEEVCVSLAIVPEKNILHQKTLDGMLVCLGVNDISEIGPTDIAEYGLEVMFGEQTFTYQEFQENEKRILDLATMVAEDCCEMLFGFYMDKHLNRIGTTGWDMAESWLTGKNPFEAAIERYGRKD